LLLAPNRLTEIGFSDASHPVKIPLAVDQGVDARLQELLDRQDEGIDLSSAEREEAEGLVNLAEFLTWLRLRAERQRRTRNKPK
jgi:hypothetical protein